MFTTILNNITTISAIVIGLSGSVLIICKICKIKIPEGVVKHAYLFGFIISLGAICMSLLYSEIIGFPPCKLCWLQRIFIYPQAIVFGLALWKKYPTYIIRNIALWLTAIGGIISAYHNFIYYTDYSPLPCDAAASCTQQLVTTLGFMSIPLMALCAFIGLFAVILLLPKESKE
ncbi:disulfide bond formation protein B [Candidatus Nomurabacteria bacterium]|jgi:disulfide bond formation protein DsbB|nr:MAG: disulfide bond formation protein B [Candidatus Nomurabacteria bacterium]